MTQMTTGDAESANANELNGLKDRRAGSDATKKGTCKNIEHYANVSIEAMEAGLEANPNDAELKKDLAYAIFERYVYGVDDFEPGDERDLARVRTLVEEIPEPTSTLPRTCDQLMRDFFFPFDDAESLFWTRLSAVIDRSEIANVLTSWVR